MYNIGVIAGDGMGPEGMAGGCDVLIAVWEEKGVHCVTVGGAVVV